MDLAHYYELWRGLMLAKEANWWQTFFVRFYQAFLEADRWKQYLRGVETTLYVTALALCLGVILGVLVAMIRTAHDQQRPGQRNFALGVANLVCRIYVTIIRGTPMMVQILIMGMVVFSSSRNFTMVGALTLGINSGAYVAEIIRGGLMSLDQGQSEAGRSLGLNYLDTMRFIIIPQAFKAILPSLGLGALFSKNQYVGLAIPLAVLVAVLVWVLLEKTKLGYELKATGCNKFAAKY